MTKSFDHCVIDQVAEQPGQESDNGNRVTIRHAISIVRFLSGLQLEGGILNFFADMPDAERDWEGECFVFDNRVALDTHLRETGTTAEQVYAEDPDEAWRLRRARQLASAGQSDALAGPTGTAAKLAT